MEVHPHPPWGAGQQENQQENPASASSQPDPPAHASLGGKRDNIPHLPTVREPTHRGVNKNQPPERGLTAGTAAAPVPAARLTLGKVKVIFPNVLDSFAVT